MKRNGKISEIVIFTREKKSRVCTRSVKIKCSVPVRLIVNETYCVKNCNAINTAKCLYAGIVLFPFPVSLFVEHNLGNVSPDYDALACFESKTLRPLSGRVVLVRIARTSLPPILLRFCLVWLLKRYKRKENRVTRIASGLKGGNYGIFRAADC